MLPNSRITCLPINIFTTFVVVLCFYPSKDFMNSHLEFTRVLSVELEEGLSELTAGGVEARGEGLL